jgi:N-glycosylase/DNA lyase
MQVFYFLKNDQVVERSMMAPEVFVLPGVPWGRPDVLFTAAYWLTQYWMREGDFPDRCHRIGETFEEEVVACMLGGHGIPAEVGLAAFKRLRDRGLIAAPSPSANVLSDHLREPLTLESRQIVYRFWSQKAGYLSAALKELRARPAPLNSATVLRAYLLQLPGIGPKTASWIVRNWLGSSEVAILDIHVVRAGQLMGLYTTADRVERHYLRMEHRFLELAAAMNVPAADLDSLIWRNMRNSPRLVAGLLESHEADALLTPRAHRAKQGLSQPV